VLRPAGSRNLLAATAAQADAEDEYDEAVVKAWREGAMAALAAAAAAGAADSGSAEAEAEAATPGAADGAAKAGLAKDDGV
jgi:hypothetical protein